MTKSTQRMAIPSLVSADLDALAAFFNESKTSILTKAICYPAIYLSMRIAFHEAGILLPSDKR